MRLSNHVISIHVVGPVRFSNVQHKNKTSSLNLKHAPKNKIRPSFGNCNGVNLTSQWRPTRTMFVYKIQINPIHTILKYGKYYDLWIDNGAVLKSSSQWQ